MCLLKNFVTCGVISFKTCLVVLEEVLIACEDEMEEEIRIRVLCVSRKRKRAREIKSNQEALHMAEKLSEYARSKGMRSFHWFFQSHATDLLLEMVIQNQKQATIPDFFRAKKYCYSKRKCKIYVKLYASLLVWKTEKDVTDTFKLTSKVNSGELFKNFKFCFHRRKTV